MTTAKLTTNQARVQSWAAQQDVKKLADLSPQQVEQAARELALTPDLVRQTVSELQKSGFGDVANPKSERMLQGDLTAGAVQPHAQRDVFGGAETPMSSPALQAFEKLVTLQGKNLRGWDRAGIHEAQTTVRGMFKRDLNANEQREARLWMASQGGGWALDAVTRNPLQQFMSAVWTKLSPLDMSGP